MSAPSAPPSPPPRGASEKVLLRAHDGFSYAVGRGRITQDFLARLFLIPKGRPVCVHTTSLDVVYPSAEGTYDALEGEGQRYLVLPDWVVDSDEPEPEEYRPHHPSPERIEEMEEALHSIIHDLYTPRHPEIYTFDKSFISPSLREAFEQSDPEVVLKVIRRETLTGIYSLDFFTPEFCSKFVEEVQHYEASGLPASRPNSMNNYGLILRDVGLSPLMNEIVVNYFAPLCRLLYPHDATAQGIDSHHSFIVQYKLEEDHALDFHYDDSEFTLNVCLGKQFEGGELYFKGLLKDRSTHSEQFVLGHVTGRGVVHAGQHRHGATEILGGERYNLIIWGRNSAYREHRRKHGQACSCGHQHEQEGHEGHEGHE